MVNQKDIDRRQGVRAKRVLSIQYRTSKSRVKPLNREWRLSTTQDMSYLGLSFLADAPLHEGDILEVKIVMSGVLDIYNGLAKVVYSVKKKSAAYYLVGTKFVTTKTARKRKAKAFSSKNRLKRAMKKK